MKNDTKNDEIMNDAEEDDKSVDLVDKYQEFLNERQKIEANDDH